jgi:putative inorganic carbon (hco3(-)) transporter
MITPIVSGRRSVGQAVAAGRAPGPARTAGPDPLHTLHPRVMWRYILTQPVSFWLINVYLFFEYFRPQQIYPVIDVLPWARFSILAALGAFLLFDGGRFRFSTAADRALLLFTGVVLLSCFTAVYPGVAFAKVTELFLPWVLIYMLTTNIITTERRLLVFVTAWLLYSVKMAQSGVRSWASSGFAFRKWGIVGPPGWFGNPGEFAIQMVVFLAVVVFFIAALRPDWGRKTRLFFYAMPVMAVLCIIGANTRGSLLALGVVGLVMMYKARLNPRAILLGIVAVGFVLYFIPPELWERLDNMGDDGTSTNRRLYWAYGLEIIRQYPVLGIGFQNWLPHFQADMGYPALPHNIFIEAGAELGYVGLGAFLTLIASTLWVNHRTRQVAKTLGDRGRLGRHLSHGFDVALFGYLAAGFFVTVLYYPFFWINLAMTVALYHATCDTQRKLAGAVPGKGAGGGPRRLPMRTGRLR